MNAGKVESCWRDPIVARGLRKVRASLTTITIQLLFLHKLRLVSKRLGQRPPRFDRFDRSRFD